MKRLLLLTLLSVPFAAPTALAEGSLTVTPAVHDFGVVTEGVSLSHRFTVANEGNVPLSVVRVRTSCGCTASQLDKTELAPGETAQLTVTYDTLNRPGAFTKTVHLFTDTSKTETVITVNGTVIPLPHPNATITPNPVSLGEIVVNADTQVSFTLGNNGDAELIVERMILLDPQQNPVLEIATRPHRYKPGESESFTITVRPREAGPVRYYLEVTTNNPKTPRTYATFFGTGVTK
jgi:hypothetical protein